MRPQEIWIDLFDKLPDEVLEVILSYLESPRDLTNVTKASSICANILHPKKIIYLFHELVPQLSLYLTKLDLLNIRLACKEWKSSTDAHLENSEMFNDEIYFRSNSPFWPRRSRSITDFLIAMRFHNDSSPKINPFPGRRAAFGGLRRQAPDVDYWYNVLRLLNEFGSELWDCRLDFEDIPFEKFITVLSDCLRSLPSLKRLHIVYFGRPSLAYNLTINYQIFPILPHLYYLELNGTFPSVFYNAVILHLYSRCLIVLKLHQILPSDVSLVGMPQLEVIRVLVKSPEDLKRVLSRDSTGLRDISMTMYLSQENDLRQLFEHLHVYRSTLKTLEILFDTLNGTGNVITNLYQPFLQTFPILNVLKVKNAPVQLLESLESFPSVTNLELECLEKGEFFLSQPTIEQSETCRVLKFCGYPANQLYSSNIWNMLTSLETCRLSCYQLFSGRELKYNYSRARYEYLQRALC